MPRFLVWVPTDKQAVVVITSGSFGRLASPGASVCKLMEAPWRSLQNVDATGSALGEESPPSASQVVGAL